MKPRQWNIETFIISLTAGGKTRLLSASDDGESEEVSRRVVMLQEAGSDPNWVRLLSDFSSSVEAPFCRLWQKKPLNINLPQQRFDWGHVWFCRAANRSSVYSQNQLLHVQIKRNKRGLLLCLQWRCRIFLTPAPFLLSDCKCHRRSVKWWSLPSVCEGN